MQNLLRSLRFAILLALAAAPTPAFAQSLTAEGRAYISSQLGGYGDDVWFVDFAGDSRPDVIRGGDNGSSSYLLPSVLDGNSAWRSVYHGGGLPILVPTGLTVADLDGDGLREILHSSTSGWIFIHVPDGQGGFQQGPQLPNATLSGQLASGDFDGDGDPDVLLVGESQSMALFENQGGALTLNSTTTTGSFGAEIEVGDLDGDGDLDAVVAQLGGAGLAVMWNQGGAFVLATIPVGAPSNSVELTDVDLDGDLDILVGQGTLARVTLVVNSGAGSFAPPVSFATGPGCSRMEAGDLDGDGDPDVAVTNTAATQAISILRNLGGGAFGPFSRLGAGPYQGLGVVDLDQDGDLDIAVVGGQALWNRGDATFEVPSATPFVGDPYQVVRAADLDGDGDEDLAISGWNGNFYTRRNQGGGVFVSGSTSAMFLTNGRDLVLADIDGDGDLDAACRGSSRVYVCRNSGNATFGTATLVSSTNVFGLLAGDLDGDGAIDLVARTNTEFQFARNQGPGTFAPFVTFAATPPMGVYGQDLADLDGDGDLDLVVWSGSDVRVYRNLGAASFAAPVAVGSAVLPYPQLESGNVAADLDLDNDLDLVGMSASGPVVHWNLGGMIFSPPVALGGFPGTLQVEDLDGDGDLDLLGLSSRWTTSATIHENLGGGAFAAPAPFGTGGAVGGFGAVPVDTDEDGDQDFVSITLSQLFVLENYASSGATFCLGDGSVTACPCGNASTSNLRAGCTSSSGNAGALRARGSTSLARDGLVLVGSNMSNSTALYFQGTSGQNGGLGTVFGDGLRCAAGTVTRLAVVFNVLGASAVPAPGGTPLRVLGGVTAPGERTYQVWYRDAAAFCTPSTFNLTNGVVVLWRP